jgi:hypothetical protein
VARVPVRLVDCSSEHDPGIGATTAQNGTFTFAEGTIPAAHGLQVRVQPDDYAAECCHVAFEPERQQEQRIDLGTIRLVRGTLFSGHVVDQDGRPVPDAPVFLPQESRGYSPYGPVLALEFATLVAHTDLAGRFRLGEPLAPALDRASALFAVCGQGIGWCAFEASKQRREVTDLVIRLRPGADVRVLVQDPEGEPQGDVAVRALPRFGPLGIEDRSWRTDVSRDPRIMGRFAGRTDAHGELSLPGLPIGEPSLFREGRYHERLYDLAVEAAGYPQQPLHGIELRAGSEIRTVIRLVANRSVHLAVDVRDDRGEPIAGADVTAWENESVAARTDTRGHADLAVPVTGKPCVAAEAAGHRAARAHVDVASAAPTPVTLTLPRTRPLRSLPRRRLPDGRPRADRGDRIELGREPLDRRTDADGGGRRARPGDNHAATPDRQRGRARGDRRRGHG